MADKTNKLEVQVNKLDSTLQDAVKTMGEYELPDSRTVAAGKKPLYKFGDTPYKTPTRTTNTKENMNNAPDKQWSRESRGQHHENRWEGQVEEVSHGSATYSHVYGL